VLYLFIDKYVTVILLTVPPVHHSSVVKSISNKAPITPAFLHLHSAALVEFKKGCFISIRSL